VMKSIASSCKRQHEVGDYLFKYLLLFVMWGTLIASLYADG
jgi:hypothetical protein